MSFTLDLKKNVKKELEDLPFEVQQRILREIALLLENPFKQGVIQLTGENSFRTRVGDYRIVFEVDEVKKVVTLVTVGHRSKVYKN